MYLCKINISCVRNLPELRYEVKQPNWIWREALKNLKSSQNRTHSLGLLCLWGWWKRRGWLPVSSQSVQIGSYSKEQPLEYIFLYLSNWIGHSWLIGRTNLIHDWSKLKKKMFHLQHKISITVPLSSGWRTRKRSGLTNAWTNATWIATWWGGTNFKH